MSVLKSHRRERFYGHSGESGEGFPRVGERSDNYKVIFVQGGASTMFASNVLNLCPTGRKKRTS